MKKEKNEEKDEEKEEETKNENTPHPTVSGGPIWGISLFDEGKKKLLARDYALKVRFSLLVCSKSP